MLRFTPSPMDASLLAWARTFGDADDLTSFCDGSVLLCVAQDTMEDPAGCSGVPQDLSGLLQLLERAYEVRLMRKGATY